MFKLNKSLLSGSIILLIAFNIYNAMNFFFQFSMARMLSLVDYGILATLFSIIYISSVFSESIQTIIMKYSSAENDKGKLKNLIKRSLKKALKMSVIFLAIYLVISIPLSHILKINYILLVLDGIVILYYFLSPVNRGIMLGKKLFKSLAGNLMIETIPKIVLAITFVFIGWNVYGAMTATIIAMILAFSFSFISLNPILKSKEKNAKTDNIYQYSAPVFFVTMIIILFYSIDVIIAKIVFDSQAAGAYAIASILSKTIFWGTQPISKAMFPLSAENGKNRGKSKNIFMNSLFLLSACILVALAVFYLFPDFVIQIFSGKNIVESSSILFTIGLSLSLLSLTNLVLLYKLSKGNTKGYLYLLVFLVIEVILLFVFSSSLAKFSLALLVSAAIFLIGSIFVLREQK